jgi:phage shock protein A
VLQLNTTISTYENDLITLRGRATTAASPTKIKQQLANVDSSSTIAMMERMKDNVEADEALAQAYGEVADADTSIDTEINRALAGAETPRADNRLAELKARMGLTA